MRADCADTTFGGLGIPTQPPRRFWIWDWPLTGGFLRISLIVLLTMMACTTPGYGGPVPLRTVAKGAFSGIAKARQEVIKDKAAWNKLWTQHIAQGPLASKMPEADFAKEMLLMVTMGQQRTGGYTIEIVKVETVDKRLRISVSRESPPPGAMAIQALTAPFHVVAVPRSDAKPEFVEAKAGP